MGKDCCGNCDCDGKKVKTGAPDSELECCPKFDPAPWDEKQITWTNKLFVKDRVTSIFHIPLNFGSVMTKNITKIDAVGAKDPLAICLSDENSLFGSDVYISVTKSVPGATMAKLSGTFLSKAFEGEFKEMGNWIKAMQSYVAGKNKEIKKMYFYYTTCPKCAQKWGKNYVVILAQI